MPSPLKSTISKDRRLPDIEIPDPGRPAPARKVQVMAVRRNAGYSVATGSVNVWSEIHGFPPRVRGACPGRRPYVQLTLPPGLIGLEEEHQAIGRDGRRTFPTRAVYW